MKLIHLWKHFKAFLLILPLALLSSGSAYASLQFGMHHNVFPFWIALAGALGFESLYILVSLLSIDAREREAFKNVQIIAAITAIVFGTLYVADRYGVVDNILVHTWVRWLFAVIHICPLIILSGMYAMLKHDIEHKASLLKAKEEEEEKQYQKQQERLFAEKMRAQDKEQCSKCGRWYKTGKSMTKHIKSCQKT